MDNPLARFPCPRPCAPALRAGVFFPAIPNRLELATFLQVMPLGTMLPSVRIVRPESEATIVPRAKRFGISFAENSSGLPSVRIVSFAENSSGLPSVRIVRRERL